MREKKPITSEIDSMINSFVKIREQYYFEGMTKKDQYLHHLELLSSFLSRISDIPQVSIKLLQKVVIFYLLNSKDNDQKEVSYELERLTDLITILGAYSDDLSLWDDFYSTLANNLVKD